MTLSRADVLLERFERVITAVPDADRSALIDWLGTIVAQVPDGDPTQIALLELLLNQQVVVTGMVDGAPRIALAPHLHDEAFARLHDSLDLRREVERLLGRPLANPPGRAQ